jgi:hypothetical protein
VKSRNQRGACDIRGVTLIIEGSRLETLSKGDEGALDGTVTKVMARRGHADVVTFVAM